MNIGYKESDIKTVLNSGSSGTIKAKPSEVRVGTTEGSNQKTVTLQPSEGTTASYVTIKGKYYPLKLEGEEISLGEALDDLPSGSGSEAAVTIVSISDGSKVGAEPRLNECKDNRISRNRRSGNSKSKVWK